MKYLKDPLVIPDLYSSLKYQSITSESRKKKKEQMHNEKFTTVKHHFHPNGNRKNAGWLPNQTTSERTEFPKEKNAVYFDTHHSRLLRHLVSTIMILADTACLNLFTIPTYITSVTLLI